MMINIDPLIIINIILVQLGNRFIKFKITNAQSKLIEHPLLQSIMFIAILYYSTKNIILSITIFLLLVILFNYLFNENSKYNLFSKKWLIEEKLINDDNYISNKEKYKNNIKKYHL